METYNSIAHTGYGIA